MKREYVWRVLVYPLNNDNVIVLDYKSFKQAEDAYCEYSSKVNKDGSKTFTVIPPFSVEVF